MGETFRVILLIALTAAFLTTGILLLSWWMEPLRRLRRLLLKTMGRVADIDALSPAEGRAAGLDLNEGQIAILWRGGGHGLIYAADEVEGAEIIVDGHVVSRVRRHAARKDLDIAVPDAEHVVLRLMFADSGNPEFELALWDVVQTAPTASPAEALRLGRRWLSHVEGLMRL